MKKRETPNAHIGQLKSNLPGHWPIEPAPIVCNPSGASEPGPYSPPTVFFPIGWINKTFLSLAILHS